MTKQSVKYQLNTDQGKQLELPLVKNSVSEHQNVSLTDSVSERKRQALQRFLDRAEKENQACVNTYHPGGRTSKYFRLSYRHNKRVKHIHIPGGNTSAKLAKYRADKLTEMIDRGAEIAELLSAIVDFKGKKPEQN